MVECPICRTPITTEAPAVHVRLEHRKSRRTGWGRRLYDSLVCSECSVTQNAESADGLTKIWGRAFIDDWIQADCMGCGLPVMLRPNPRRKVDVCSGSCRGKYYAARKPVEVAVTHVCYECGQQMQGRADRKYCSPACRQKAYREGSVMRMVDGVTDAQFEAAIETAKNQGDLSRANIIRLLER